MPDKRKSEIKFAQFEYQGWFTDPIFEPSRLWGCVGPVYSGLKPFKIAPAAVKYMSGASTPMDTLVTLQLGNGHYTLSLALARFSFKADFVDWSQEPIITNIIEATSKALTEKLNTEISTHQLQIAMQVLVPGVTMKEFTHPFLPLAKRQAGDQEFAGFILYTRGGDFMVDKSVVHEDGMFVRITRKFEGKNDFGKMAKVLLEEEKWLAAMLGIEIE